MAHKTPHEKANDLVKRAKEESDSEIRKLLLRAAHRYYRQNAAFVWEALLAVLVAAGMNWGAFATLPWKIATAAVIATYVLTALMLASILVSRGIISEPGSLTVFQQGLKRISGFFGRR